MLYYDICGGEYSNFETESSMKLIKSIMMQSKIPIFTIPGNHDYADGANGIFDFDHYTAKNYKKWIDNSYEYLFVHNFVFGNYNFVLADSGAQTLLYFFAKETPLRLILQYYPIISLSSLIGMLSPYIYLLADAALSPNPVVKWTAGKIIDVINSKDLSMNNIKETLYPYRSTGMEENQLDKIKNIINTNPNKRSFIFTHNPIVGHDEHSTHFEYTNAGDHAFVELANTENVEAVFCGHTHENHVFFNVTLNNPGTLGYIDTPKDKSPPDAYYELPYSYATFYIETTKAY